MPPAQHINGSERNPNVTLSLSKGDNDDAGRSGKIDQGRWYPAGARLYRLSVSEPFVDGISPDAVIVFA